MSNYQPTVKERISLVVVIAFVCLILQFLRPNPNAQVDEALAKVGSELNKMLPMMIDSHTRLDTVLAGIGKQVFYHYTLVNLEEKDLKEVDIQSEMKPMIVNAIKTDPSMQTFRKHGVTMHYRYFDKNRVFITEIVVGPDELK